jgi:DNA-binding IclR family transcriptional regulator
MTLADRFDRPLDGTATGNLRTVPPSNSLALVRKAVETLDILAEHGEVTPAALAEQLGEPRSSVYRLLSSLQSLGMVEPASRRGTFRLGFRLLTLGTAVAEQFDERRYARPVMDRIHDETGETVFLCVRRGREAVCIDRIDGRRVASLALKLGGALPLHAGAAPRTLLAFSDPVDWQAYLDGDPLEQLTPSTPTTAETLLPVLEETRRTGLSVSDQDVTIGVAALGVPVLDYRGQLRAALSISGVREAILGADGDRVRELLIEGGKEVSQALGWESSSTKLVDFG